MEVETGKLLWLYPYDTYSGNRIVDPLVFGEKVFCTDLYDQSVLLDIGGGKPKVLWKNRDLLCEINSLVMIDGYIYGTQGGPDLYPATFRCLSVQTGELKWEKEFARGSVLSVTAAVGMLIILEENGTLHIAEATPSSYQEISSCDVFAGKKAYRKFWTSPVLYGSKVYCRNNDGNLLCINVSK